MNAPIEGAIALLIAVAVIAPLLRRAAARALRRERERFAARTAIVTRAPRPVAPRPVAPPTGPRPGSPAGRLPQRTDIQPAAARPVRRPAIFGGGSARWAADAIVAAEVLGPPVANRPGGTLGPPPAF